MSWYHEQLKQLVGAEIIQVEFIQPPDFSDLVPCLVVRKNGNYSALFIWADAEGNAPGWVNLREINQVGEC